MKSIFKQENGVSLISLGIAIIIMMIITSMLVYSTKDTTQVNKLSKMYDDIANLRDKISVYYAKYGEIPTYKEQEITFNQSIVGANDTGAFYVIDLKAMDGLTLNYGADYESIRNGIGNNTDIGNDLYIINETSHNIFYLKGITIDNNTYYTNYTDAENDEEKVDLRYVDGIKIPDGYYYIGKNNDTIIISNVLDDTYSAEDSNQYQWKIKKSDISIGENDDYTLNGKTNVSSEFITLIDEFTISTNEKGGYFENLTDSKNLLFIPVQDTWSPEYMQEGTYTDEDGYIVYIPAGFCVSTRPSMNKIKKGLVIKNNTTSDEYVWIDVPKYITSNCATTQQIEEALQNYTSNYREDGYKDVWYDGCWINGSNNNSNGYNSLKESMLNSIKINGGFYIGRYEVGQESEIKKDIPVLSKTIKDAQAIAEGKSPENYKSSLMFGIQWDLVCKFIANNANLTNEQIKTDSSNWGNYNDKTLTGAKQILNIFDIADNDSELTLENGYNKPVARGGTSEDKYVIYRQSIDKTDVRTFRTTLFK